MPRERKQQTSATGEPIYRAHLLLDPIHDQMLDQIRRKLGYHSRSEAMRALIVDEARRLALDAQAGQEARE